MSIFTRLPITVSDTTLPVISPSDINQIIFSPKDFFVGGVTGGLYDPNTLSSLFQDAAMLIPVGNINDPVRAMKDLSGGGNHMVAPSDAARPLLKQSAGGIYYLQFDGVDDRFDSITSDFLGAKVSIAIADSFTAERITFSSTGAVNTSFNWRTRFDGFRWYSSASSTNIAAISGAVALRAYQYLLDGANGDGWSYQNGSLLAENLSGVVYNPATQQTPAKLHIGANHSTAYSAGDFYGACILNNVLASADQRSLLNRYYAGKIA